MKQRLAIFFTLAVALVIGGGAATRACDIPVFRYALDRWSGDVYQLHLARATAVAPDNAVLLKRKLHEYTNVIVVQDDALSPGTADLHYPGKDGTVAWSGPFNPDTLDRIVESPARAAIAQRICDGQSAVWVLLEGADRDATNKAAAALEGELHHVEQTAKLPVARADDPSSLPGPGPALRIGFSMLRINRSDPAEAVTVAMLENFNADPKPDPTQPMALLVFGRGHVLAALPAADLNPVTINNVSQYVLGSCSCEVKDQHPGWDLLMDQNWDDRLQAVEAARDKGTPSTQVVVAAQPETIQTTGSDPAPAPQAAAHSNFMPLLGAIGVGVVGLSGILLLVGRRKAEKPKG